MEDEEEVAVLLIVGGIELKRRQLLAALRRHALRRALLLRGHELVIGHIALQRIFLESVEYCAQITLTCIWQESDNLLTFVFWTFGYLGGSEGCGT